MTNSNESLDLKTLATEIGMLVITKLMADRTIERLQTQITELENQIRNMKTEVGHGIPDD